LPYLSNKAEKFIGDRAEILRIEICQVKGLCMEDYAKVEQMFQTNFSKMCRTEDGLRYLKVRTLIDREALKRSSSLKEFLAKLGIQFTTINSKEIQRIRNELYSTFPDHKSLDPIIRTTYLELYGKIHYDRLMQSLKLVAKKGDQYWQGWNSVYKDKIRDHIQHHFVRQFSIQDLNVLLEKIHKELFSVVEGYTVISWYNQWTSTIIERFFTFHPKVVPTVRRIDKVDFFFRDVPLDLKVTFLPAKYVKKVKKENRIHDDRFVIEQVKQKPLTLAKWLYENQGEPRFSDSNRLFVVLINENNLEDSWKLKANFDIIKSKINAYLEATTALPEIMWEFKGKGIFVTFADVILITDNSGSSS
jgi:hypothetical protein